MGTDKVSKYFVLSKCFNWQFKTFCNVEKDIFSTLTQIIEILYIEARPKFALTF